MKVQITGNKFSPFMERIFFFAFSQEIYFSRAEFLIFCVMQTTEIEYTRFEELDLNSF